MDNIVQLQPLVPVTFKVDKSQRLKGAWSLLRYGAVTVTGPLTFHPMALAKETVRALYKQAYPKAKV